MMLSFLFVLMFAFFLNSFEKIRMKFWKNIKEDEFRIYMYYFGHNYRIIKQSE